MTDQYDKIGELIRERREARGWSQELLGQKAGTSQQNVDRIERGLVKHSRFLQYVLEALGMDVDRAVNATASTEDVIPRDLLLTDTKDLPIYPSAEGGVGAIVIDFEPVDFVIRPTPLLHVKDGFGVLISEDSMAPALEPGDIALVNPRVTPRKGKNAVFLGADRQGRVRALVKQLVGQTESVWKVHQWNPDSIFELSKAEWPHAYAIVGKYDAR